MIDPLWFVSLVVLALYAYLEEYASAVLDVVATNSRIRRAIESYLSGTGRQTHDRTRVPVLTVEQLRGAGMKKKLSTIERSLSIDGLLHDMIGEEKYKAYTTAFEKYVEIRGKIAHKSPRLGANEYTDAHFGIDVGEFDSRLIPETIRAGPLLRENIEEMSKSLFNLLKMTLSINAVVKMATQYPALLDCVLSVLVKHPESI